MSECTRPRANPAQEFFLLWVLGQDLAGVITIEPADGEALPPNVQQLVTDICKPIWTGKKTIRCFAPAH